MTPTDGGTRWEGDYVALLVARDGRLAAGAEEAAAEAGGRVLIAGDRCADALDGLGTDVTDARIAELGAFRPGAFAAALAGLLEATRAVILPASPDGRDLAPRLAVALGRPLFAGAIAVRGDEVVVVRLGGRLVEHHAPQTPFVATLEPGCRAVPGPRPDGAREARAVWEVTVASSGSVEPSDATVLGVSEPAPGTAELRDAAFVVAGGAGLGGPERFAELDAVGRCLGASVGATRIATDAGWAPADRQIGTTGVDVRPTLYAALGISGAVQHVGGIGRPEHVLAVNLDPACPMMQMADLAVVCDVPALVRELTRRLGTGQSATAKGSAPSGAHHG